MNVVVTGASGFIGRRVVAALVKKDINTIAIARTPTNYPNSVCVESYFHTPPGDVLVHLADTPDRAVVNKIGKSYADEAFALTKELVAKKYQRIIFASSVVVYGDEIKDAHKPSDPVYCGDVYSRSKLACEKLILQNNGVIARISNIYGPGMSNGNVLSTIIDQISESKTIKIWDDRPVRDFLWIDDVEDALVRMITGSAEGIYNVASGTAVSIRNLVEIVLGAFGSKEKCNLQVTNPDHKESTIALDISETSLKFGWIPKMKLEYGIKRMLENKR